MGVVRIVAQMLEYLAEVVVVLAIPPKRMNRVESLARTTEPAGQSDSTRQAGARVSSENRAVVERVTRAVDVSILSRAGQGVEMAHGGTRRQQQKEASIAEAVKGVKATNV